MAKTATKKDKIEAFCRKFPDLTAQEVADKLGAAVGYVHSVRSERGLTGKPLGKVSKQEKIRQRMKSHPHETAKEIAAALKLEVQNVYTAMHAERKRAEKAGAAPRAKRSASQNGAYITSRLRKAPL